jgi:uncharacterized DUF497 family protein
MEQGQRRANAIKHGVSFADATKVFNDVFAVHVVDRIDGLW